MNRYIPFLVLAIFLFPTKIIAETSEYKINDKIHIKVIEKPFDPSQHKIEMCTGSDFPCKIDGIFPYGTAFALPSVQLTELIVTINNHSISLNTSGMYDAWGNREIENEGHKYLSVKQIEKDTYSVKGIFSDGAGTFVAEWKITNNKSQRILISADESLMYPFMEKIDKE